MTVSTAKKTDALNIWLKCKIMCDICQQQYANQLESLPKYLAAETSLCYGKYQDIDNVPTY